MQDTASVSTPLLPPLHPPRSCCHLLILETHRLDGQPPRSSETGGSQCDINHPTSGWQSPTSFQPHQLQANPRDTEEGLLAANEDDRPTCCVCYDNITL